MTCEGKDKASSCNDAVLIATIRFTVESPCLGSYHLIEVTFQIFIIFFGFYSLMPISWQVVGECRVNH